VVAKEFSTTLMTLYRWSHNPNINFPPPVKSGFRNHRYRSHIEMYKERLWRDAIKTQSRVKRQ
jgi:hypothetical protein